MVPTRRRWRWHSHCSTRVHARVLSVGTGLPRLAFPRASPSIIVVIRPGLYSSLHCRPNNSWSNPQKKWKELFFLPRILTWELVQWEDASCLVRGIPEFWLTAMKNHDDIQVLCGAPEYRVPPSIQCCTLRFSLLFFITREPPIALHALAPDPPAHSFRRRMHGTMRTWLLCVGAGSDRRKGRASAEVRDEHHDGADRGRGAGLQTHV